MWCYPEYNLFTLRKRLIPIDKMPVSEKKPVFAFIFKTTIITYTILTTYMIVTRAGVVLVV